ncbi:hypothetical protein MA16_Dca021799 [Dendrobium catenatum]|uniref:Uncharacterized protein n=1 Tax=Dendrobium catenatum TaxID=906689 RepID=A0A2I0WXV7_9ASPA|nr:hypothetical protein MA16_Dca021799 [Dendrobium catenatum]
MVGGLKGRTTRREKAARGSAKPARASPSSLSPIDSKQRGVESPLLPLFRTHLGWRNCTGEPNGSPSPDLSLFLSLWVGTDNTQGAEWLPLSPLRALGEHEQ